MNIKIALLIITFCRTYLFLQIVILDVFVSKCSKHDYVCDRWCIKLFSKTFTNIEYSKKNVYSNIYNVWIQILLFYQGNEYSLKVITNDVENKQRNTTRYRKKIIYRWIHTIYIYKQCTHSIVQIMSKLYMWWRINNMKYNHPYSFHGCRKSRNLEKNPSLGPRGIVGINPFSKEMPIPVDC